jgi:hypothetical protein
MGRLPKVLGVIGSGQMGAQLQIPKAAPALPDCDPA